MESHVAEDERRRGEEDEGPGHRRKAAGGGGLAAPDGLVGEEQDECNRHRARVAREVPPFGHGQDAGEHRHVQQHHAGHDHNEPPVGQPAMHETNATTSTATAAPRSGTDLYQIDQRVPRSP